MTPREKKLAYETQMFLRRKAMNGTSRPVIRQIQKALHEKGLDERGATGRTGFAKADEPSRRTITRY